MDKNKNLFEGIKFGQKEMQAVRDASSDFRVGIEYEFNVNEEDSMVDFNPDPDASFATNFEMLEKVLEHGSRSAESVYDDFIDDDNTLDGLDIMAGDPRNSSRFNGLLVLAHELSNRIKNTQAKDTETKDLFGGEGLAEGYAKLLTDVATSVKDFVIEDTDYMTLGMSTFIEICYLYDILMHGDAFGGNDDLIRELYEFLKYLRIGGDDLSFSETDNPSDEVMRFVSFVNKSQLQKIPDPEEFSYTFDGFNSSTIEIQEIIDYEEEHGPLDFLDSAFAVYIQTLEVERDFNEKVTLGELSEAGVDTDMIREITTDHYDMVEIITHPLPVNAALENIKEMFEFIRERGETFDYAGMHISISTTQHDLDDFDLMKFVTLMDLPHVLNYFPAREYVQSLQDIVEDKISQYMSGNMTYDIDYGSSMTDVAMDALNYAREAIDDHKEQSIKFGDYEIMDGRIELRFFGGEDYHNRQDEIFTHLLRALYLLTFAYTDEHDKTYKKKMVRMISNVFKERVGMTYSYVFKALKEIHELDPNLYLDDMLKKTDDISDSDVRESVKTVLRRYFKNEGTIKRIRRFL